MTVGAVAAAIVLGLIVNEMSDVSPWLARKLVVWSAQLRYGEASCGDVRAEELMALIEHRPGKLLKVGTALGFFASSLLGRIRRRVTGDPDPGPDRMVDPRSVLPLEAIASNLVARYLYPTERYRGEWRHGALIGLRSLTSASC